MSSTWEAPPPSYQSVMSDLHSKLGSSPNLNSVHIALSQLPVGEVKAPLTDAPTLTDDQKSKYANKVVDIITSPEGDAALKATMFAATAAVKSTEDAFNSLQVELVQIDAKFTSPTTGAFAPRLVAIHTRWKSAVEDSKSLATRIGSYADRFSVVILPLVTDQSETAEFKRQKLDEFIAKAQEFEAQSLSMTSAYSGVLDDFTTLTASFATWASEQTVQLNKNLTKALEEMSELQDKLADNQKKLIGVGAGAALTLPITAVAAMLTGPAAPFVIVAGLIAATALTATAIVLATQATSIRHDITNKQAEIDGYKKEIQDLDVARENLVKLGKVDLALLRTNIAALSQIWVLAKTDAVRAQEALKEASLDVGWKKQFPVDVDKVMNIYKVMGQYLLAYAEGIELN
ncbi:hypothetical protein N0V93_001397 [Gnomoniopsis smithogilvyi]|uniref:Uncharacterized protein n=1 Tax=Gnomoniopsis smithogilvyi TaxID=1191159 RepID=A0A9W9D1L8_9PEZI|nr:hypothetical protein N0V93_001397 [Gnomoniopsis smithogilvyi]